MGFNKTECPISREQFKSGAKPIKVTVEGREFELDPKEFSTKSLGWNLSDKADVMVGGVKCKCQIGLNVTIIGSKEAPETKPGTGSAPATPAAA